jgi:dolichol-phosphate mannosyltransferase
MKFSVVIPAFNEAENLPATVSGITQALAAAGLDHEIVVVNDGSSDDTEAAAARLAAADGRVRLVHNAGPHGFGLTVRSGLAASTGDAVAVMMADGSDSPADLVAYCRKILEGYDCVFGSRFIRDGRVTDYPLHKLLLNRLANWFIRVLFHLPYNDITNAFKCYRRTVLGGIGPLISNHFNLTVEMPLKAIVRGYSYTVIPISWTNRRHGMSNLKIQEMGSRYLFIVLYVWLEKLLARGDYHRDKVFYV